MFVRKYTTWPFNLLFIILGFGLFIAVQSIVAWDGPDSTPPNDNIAEPINVGSGAQSKNGNLLVRGILGIDNNILRFYSNNILKHVTIQPSDSMTSSYALTLPISAPASDDSTPILMAYPSGELYWGAGGSDDDWAIETGTTPASIYTDKFTAVIESLATADANISGSGDLYVENDLEVDGNSYFNMIGLGGNVSSGTGFDAFILNSGGHIGPSTTDVHNLGSDTHRWANIFTNNIDVSGNLKTDLASGSVVFSSVGNLSEDNDNFYWDDSNNRLGVNTKDPSAPLHVKSVSSLSGTISILDEYGDPEGVNIVGSGTSFNSEEVAVGDSLIITNTTDGVSHRAEITSVTSDTALVTDDYYFFEVTPDNNNWDVIKKVVLENNDLQFSNTGNVPSIIYFGDETFIHNSGTSLVGGSHANTNTFVGLSAGSLPQDSESVYEYVYNSAFGYNTMTNIADDGYRNSAFGAESMYSLVAGNKNTALGYRSLYTNASGIGNVAIGDEALLSNLASYNTSVGTLSLKSNSTGVKNVAMGYESLKGNTSGADNVVVGYKAAFVSATGNKNVFIGSGAAAGNSAGDFNVSIGFEAGKQNDNNENVFIGNEAGLVNSGAGNVVIGSQAGYSADGNGNVFIGNKAGYDETGDATLYINSFTAAGNDDKDYSLLYGEFYSSGLHDTPLLRVNGNLGVSSIGEIYEPASLLHLYKTTGDNPEMRFQASEDETGTFEKQWAMYMDRNSNRLSFWHDRGDDYYTGKTTGAERADLNNILNLAVGTDSDNFGGRVGVNISSPKSTLELHDGLAGTSGLTLSNYDGGALGGTGGYVGGWNEINFLSGRFDIEGTAPTDKYEWNYSAKITSGYFNDSSTDSQSLSKNAQLIIKTINEDGGLDDTIVAQNNKVGIAGGIQMGAGIDRALRVHGDTMSDNYYSDSDYKGVESLAMCVVVDMSVSAEYSKMFFEDGLLICVGGNWAGGCSSSCTLDKCVAGNTDCFPL